MILEGNAFIERILPVSVARRFSDDEMAVYRAPFPTPESRRPMLALPRDLPIETPTHFEFVLNQKIATELGVRFDPATLIRADEVIE